MTKHIIISDPFPRSLNLIFTKEKLKELKKKYKLIEAPIINKKKFYEKNIEKASFIMGQPDLDTKLLSKATKLKCIVNAINYCSLSSVDVLKGPASALYGSDALGGVISFNSLKAENLLDKDESFKIETPSYFNGSNTFDAGTISVSYKTSGSGSDSTAAITKVAVLQDVRSTGTNGGTASASSWHQRRLNSKIDDQRNSTFLARLSVIAPLITPVMTTLLGRSCPTLTVYLPDS